MKRKHTPHGQMPRWLRYGLDVFILTSADDLRHCGKSDRWLVKIGGVWSWDDTELAFQWCREACEACRDGDPTNRKLDALSRISSIFQVLWAAKTDPNFGLVHSPPPYTRYEFALDHPEYIDIVDAWAVKRLQPSP